MRTINLTGQTGKCEILVGEKLEKLNDYVEYVNCRNKNMKKVLICDKNVGGYHRDRLPNWESVELEASEENKTLETVEKIYKRFVDLELDRSSFVVGVGGGIVCDITGYAASTYLRGVNFGFVPTTLLAQVDASIGGKNGVNYQGYKNLIGTIKQPKFVLCDVEVLKTLSKQEIRCGYAEVIKHGAIADAELFEYLENKVDEALELEIQTLEKIIYGSILVKVKIVEKDESETFERMKLNFGHTIGHAIELTCNIPHGEAIAAGMVIAAKLSVKKGLLDKESTERLENLLQEYELPVTIKQKMSRVNKGKVIDAIRNAIRKDKKRRNELINLVLLEKIGNAVIAPTEISELEGVLEDY